MNPDRRSSSPRHAARPKPALLAAASEAADSNTTENIKSALSRVMAIKPVSVRNQAGASAATTDQEATEKPTPEHLNPDPLVQVDTFIGADVRELLFRHPLYSTWISQPFEAVQQYMRERAGLDLVEADHVKVVELSSVGDAATGCVVKMFSAKISVQGERVEAVGTRGIMAVQMAAAKALTSW